MINYTPTDDVADVHDREELKAFLNNTCQTPLAPRGELCGQKAVHFDGYPCCQECYDSMKEGPA